MCSEVCLVLRSTFTCKTGEEVSYALNPKSIWDDYGSELKCTFR